MAAAGVKRVQTFLDHISKIGGFDRYLHRVKVLESGNGSLKALWKVEQEDCNALGNLHGGCSAHLVDVLSTAALITNFPDVPESYLKGGVSVDLNLSYLKGAQKGDEILLDCRTDKVGKRLAFLSVDIKNHETGELIVKARHTKFVGN